jgi:hypothetical protein
MLSHNHSRRHVVTSDSFGLRSCPPPSTTYVYSPKCAWPGIRSPPPLACRGAGVGGLALLSPHLLLLNDAADDLDGTKEGHPSVSSTDADTTSTGTPFPFPASPPWWRIR